MSTVSAFCEERKESRRKVLWALFLSLFFHIALVLLIAWCLTEVGGILLLAPKKVEVQQVTMNLMQPQYLETNEDQATEQAPRKARFESDKNTRAASELRAKGKAPLPTLNGKQTEVLQFQNRKYSPGKTAGGTPPTTASVAKQPQPKQQEATKAQAASTPLPPTPLPILKPEIRPAEITGASQPQPLSHPTLPRPPSPAMQPGYQSETHMVRIDGNISNRGRAATDVVATPLGRYKKLLSNAIGARWYYLIQQDMDMYRIGTVAIRFRIEQSGKIEGVKVISNTSNELLAATSIQSITDAEMPPIPPEVAGSLHNGRIEVDYSFSIMSN